MPHSPELATYLAQHRWLFDQFLTELGHLGDDDATRRVESLTEANTALGIVNHVAGVTRAYVLGIACGLDVERDRGGEFAAANVTPQSIGADLSQLDEDMTEALSSLDRERLETPLTPPPALYGVGEPRQMTAREAIVENIRHLGIHLGELRMVRGLLSEPRRADG